MRTYVKRSTVGSGHVSVTCRTGTSDDRLAVVDAQGQVHGTTGLRVADTSIMPHIPSGNTRIPGIMVAVKIAANIARAA